MNFRTTYIGHIDERKRPEGFPKTVSCFIEVRDESIDHYKELMDGVATVFAQQGMRVLKDANTIKHVVGNPSLDIDNQFFVPGHMITHIETVTEVIELEEGVVKTKIQ